MNSRKWTVFSISWQMFYACSIALIVCLCGSWMTTGRFGVGTVLALVLIGWYIFMIFQPSGSFIRFRRAARVNA